MVPSGVRPEDFFYKYASDLNINFIKCEIILVGKVENIKGLAQVMNCRIGAVPTTYYLSGSPIRSI